MIITNHAINRFIQRITDAPRHIIESFIRNDIYNSELLYKMNDIEKRICNGIVYVIKKSNKTKVITLYLQPTESKMFT